MLYIALWIHVNFIQKVELVAAFCEILSYTRFIHCWDQDLVNFFIELIVNLLEFRT